MLRGILFGLIAATISLAFNFAFNSGIDLWWAFGFSAFGYYLGRQEAKK